MSGFGDRSRVVLAVVVLAASMPAAQVSAQRVRSSERETSAARALFQQGVDEARQEHWTEAAGFFRRSYEIVPRALTMMNLAGALTRSGRLVEAAEAYRSFLSVARTGRAVRVRREAEAELRALDDRIPRVRVLLLGLDDADVVRIDDRALDAAALDLPVPVDPGPHVLYVVRLGHERSVSFESAESSTQDVALDVRAEFWPILADDDPQPTAEAPPLAFQPQQEPSRSIADEPAFWIVLGVVVAGGVAAAIAVPLTMQPPPERYQGNLAPMGLAL